VDSTQSSSEQNGSQSTFLKATPEEYLDSSKLNHLFRALSPAASIRRHNEYYLWLQNEINLLLPHDAMLAAWGDFESGEINYDLASALPELNTRKLLEWPALDAFSSTLYDLACSRPCGWSVLHKLEDAALIARIVKYFPPLKLASADMESLLVYFMRCERGKHECVYVFYSSKKRIETDQATLDLLMPYVDAALRRFECLHREVDSPQIQTGIDALSQRELEVMNWVGQGKTNHEIGGILGISHNTVKNHLKRIFNKMDVTARSQAVRVYVQNQAI